MELGRALVYPFPWPAPWQWPEDLSYWRYEPDWWERLRVGLSLGAAALLHLLLILTWSVDQPGPRRPVETPPQKFVKQRAPERRPLTRPLTRQLQAAPQRPMARRPLVAPTPSAPARLATPGPLVSRAPLGSLPLASTTSQAPPAMVRSPELAARRVGPPVREGAVEGARGTGEQIDLGAELMGVQALDTGRDRAVVVVDPQDRKGLKGFLYLSSIASESVASAERSSATSREFINQEIERRDDEAQMLRGLADKMSRQTQVTTKVLDGLRLDDPQLMKVPFVLFTVTSEFEVSAAEARNLGRYMTQGGFVYFEVVKQARTSDRQGEQDVVALRALVESAFREAGYSRTKDWHFDRLSMDHPVYHSYYDIESLPRGMRDIWYWYWPESQRPEPTPEYLEGIYFQGQMVGLYSLKNYGDFWAGKAERMRDADAGSNFQGMLSSSGVATVAPETRAYQLGVNILVYALTREGGLARKLVRTE